MLFASRQDIRERRAGNIFWLLIAAAGLIPLVSGLATAGMPFLVPVAVSFIVTLVITFLFYWLGLFGAADAKSLIAISLVFPAPPQMVILSRHFPLFNPPLPDLFPFALTVLMNAALLALLVPLSLGVRNLFVLGPGGFFKHPGRAFTGYQVPVSELKNKKHVRLISPFGDKDTGVKRGFLSGGVEINDEIIARLETDYTGGKSDKNVWVTPELPYMVFITAGFLAAVLIGNLVFALVFRA